MSDRDEFGAFLIGFFVGGVTGAIAALLLAPQSGAETRTLIHDKAIELKDKASENIEDAYKKAEEAAAEAQARFEDLASKTKVQAEELQRRGAALLEEQKEKLGRKKPAAEKPASDEAAA